MKNKTYKGFFEDYFLVVEAESEEEAIHKMRQMYIGFLKMELVQPILWEEDNNERTGTSQTKEGH